MALRYEDVETSRRQYSTQNRLDAPSLRSNNTQEWLPGLSATYQLNDNWQVLGGVHKGFSPLGGGAKSEEKPESSVNYEAGLRYDNDQLFVEAIGFWSDFNNKAENCSNGNPCSNGATSGSYVTGDAVIAGLEFQFSSSFLIGSMTLPIDIAYTFTKAEVSKDNITEGLFDGDKLAHIPDHTLSLRAGIETAMGWDNYVSVKYIDETCNAIGCAGTFKDTDAFVSADLFSHYALNDSVTVFLKVENVLDKRAIVSRSPDGARPNKGRMASVGFSMDF
jgi:Fe(3+) dicitrate transport protein